MVRAIGAGVPHLNTQQLAQRIQSDLDTDGDGAVSKGEFTRGGERVKAPSSGQAPANAPSAEELFAELDADASGGLSLDELAELAAKGGAGGDSRATGAAPPPGGPPGGAPPPGGPPGGAPPPDQGGSGVSESAAVTTYDPADTNRDGEVSDAEQLAYDLAQATSADGQVLAAMTTPDVTDPQDLGASLLTEEARLQAEQLRGSASYQAASGTPSASSTTAVSA
ncbi:MAG: hypothetical protein JXX28_08050 [Deltaproteobacteria bacterium]|nr:hypothetical protein [Deltaproteobacteria bacterium]